MKPKIFSSEIVHQNPWYRVRHDKLEWPNGAPGEYFVAEFRGAVCVICVREGKILLVEQYRYAVDKRSVEFPMGGIKKDQTPLETARLELREEAGYEAGSWEQIGSFFSLNGVAHMKMHIFFASELTEEGPQREPGEADMTMRWIELEEWRWMIQDGEVTDGETLAAWTIYQSWVNKK